MLKMPPAFAFLNICVSGMVVFGCLSGCGMCCLLVSGPCSFLLS